MNEPLRISTNRERDDRVRNVFATSEEQQRAKLDLQRKQAAHPLFLECALLLVKELSARAELSSEFFEFEWRPAALAALAIDATYGWGLYQVEQFTHAKNSSTNDARRLAIEAIRAVAVRLAQVQP